MQRRPLLAQARHSITRRTGDGLTDTSARVRAIGERIRATVNDCRSSSVESFRSLLRRNTLHRHPGIPRLRENRRCRAS